MDEILRFLESIGVRPDASWERRVLDLHRALVAANERCNLTRLTSLDDFLFGHIADSLLAVRAWPALREQALRVADVGCGGGFPGLPLAITFPRLSLREIDSIAKKVAAVSGMIAELRLESCRAVRGRAGELAREKEHRNAYDVVMARAVGAAPALLEECHGLAGRRRSAVILYKTPAQVAEERAPLAEAAAKLGFRARESDVFALPRDRGARQFWILERNA